MEKIKCKNCKKLLAIIENGYFKIKGNTDYSSNGINRKIKCKCGMDNKIK